MKINKRIESHFPEYRKKGAFIDCTISFKDHVCHAHRIILAKYSKYFFKEFTTNFQTPYVFKPTYDPQDMLEKVIDFFYENSIDITPDNVIALLAISHYYQMKNLEEIVISYIPQHINADTALPFCKKCVEFQIQDQANYFVPTIAKNWNNYSREKIFKNVDPIVLSMILLDKAMEDVNEDAKLQIIDEFFEQNSDASITDLEREKLTSVIDWSAENSYQYLTRHECSWIHPKAARPLYKKLMKERRPSVKKLYDDLQKADLPSTEDTSKWFMFTRMINIQQANPNSSDEKLTFPVINFLSTYGDLVEGFDAVVTGAINVDSSPVMSKDIKVNHALGYSKGPTFTSIGSTRFFPYYEIDFGPKAKLNLRSLKVICSSDKRREEKLRKLSKKMKETEYLSPKLKKVQVIGFKSDDKSKVVLYDGDYSEDINISTDDCGPLSKIKFVQTDKNVAGGFILRIYGIEMLGDFTP